MTFLNNGLFIINFTSIERSGPWDNESEVSFSFCDNIRMLLDVKISEKWHVKTNYIFGYNSSTKRRRNLKLGPDNLQSMGHNAVKTRLKLIE